MATASSSPSIRAYSPPITPCSEGNSPTISVSRSALAKAFRGHLTLFFSWVQVFEVVEPGPAFVLFFSQSCRFPMADRYVHGVSIPSTLHRMTIVDNPPSRKSYHEGERQMSTCHLSLQDEHERCSSDILQNLDLLRCLQLPDSSQHHRCPRNLHQQIWGRRYHQFFQ